MLDAWGFIRMIKFQRQLHTTAFVCLFLLVFYLSALCTLLYALSLALSFSLFTPFIHISVRLFHSYAWNSFNGIFICGRRCHENESRHCVQFGTVCFHVSFYADVRYSMLPDCSTCKFKFVIQPTVWHFKENSWMEKCGVMKSNDEQNRWR